MWLEAGGRPPLHPPHHSLCLTFTSTWQTRQAETCIYAVGRVRELLSQVKWCKTGEQWQDYHVILTALAPRRAEGDTDPDGMLERVANELGVTPGKRCAGPAQGQ